MMMMTDAANTMTIRRAQELHVDLQRAIYELVRGYEEATGLRVVRVLLETEYLTGERYGRTSRVVVEVSLT